MHQSSTILLNRLLARGKFRHVQVLLKLAELGSVQRAAQSVGMTQSAVTQTLAYLERLLEIQLFHRHPRGMRPTLACSDLLPVARQLLAGLTEGAEVLVARQNQGQGVIRLMASASMTNGLLIQILPEFARQAPSVQIHLKEAEGDDLLLGIARGEVDLVTCRQPAVVPEGWVFHPLLADRLAIVSAPEHPLARKRLVARAELASQTWLLAPAGSVARECFDELARGFPDGPHTYPVVSRALTPIWRLVREHGLLSMVPFSFIRHLIEIKELAEVRVDAAFPLNPLGVLAPVAEISEASSRFLAFLRQA